MKSSIALACLLAVAPGCRIGPTTTYDVTLERRQGRMVRTVIREVAWPEGLTTGPDRIEAWIGVHDDRLPKDISNSGRQIVLADALGETTIYIERFAGDDNQAAALQARLGAIDQAADLLAGWARERSAAHEDFVQVRAFFDSDFRRDMKNLAVYSWAGSMSNRRMHDGRMGDGPGRGDATARIGQYLLEHGYVTPETAPLVIKLWRRPIGDWSEEAVREFYAAIVTRMGVSDPILADRFVRLISGMGGPLRDSLADYIRGRPGYKAAPVGADADRAASGVAETRPDDPELCPTRWLLDLWSPALPWLDAFRWWFGPDTRLNLRLKSPTPPLATNGRWEDGVVIWEASLDDNIPPVCYAILVQPAERVQRRRFGRVVLSGHGLFEYCLWRAVLAEQDRRQWDQFVSGLAPGDGLVPALEAFRFDSSKHDDCPPSITGRNLLLDALENAESPP